MEISTKSPLTGDILANYQTMSWEDLVGRLQLAQKAQEKWGERSIPERLMKLRTFSAVIKQNRERYALQITLEMGKPIKESRAEIDKCASLCDLYADKAMEWLKEENVPLDGIWNKVRFEAMGTILAVMPWNFPFWQALRFAIPAIVVGNSCLLRHASNVTGCALLIEEAFKSAVFPEGLFQTLLCTHEDVERLIAHPLIAGVSFTGSTEVGAKMASLAGLNLKKSVLELGGSDPFIVCEDANIERAAKAGATSRLLNGGQSCIAAKRFLVAESVCDQFVQSLVGEMSSRKMGDPQDLLTDLGPMVNEQSAKELESWVSEAETLGAKVILRGKREGAYLSPSVLIDVPLNCSLGCKEIFGPIAIVATFKNDEEAIGMANNVEFGLSSSVWSGNLTRAESIAKKIQAGSVFINAFPKSDPRLPFGGVKKSGMGRELGRYGLLEFANIKSYSAFL